MTQSNYRLADHTLVEPLVNSWNAWWMTIAPLPASLHALNTQLLMMRSYLQSPEVHARCSRDPLLAGNNFVDVPANCQGQVKDLLQKTEGELADCLRLAESFDEFQGILLDEAKGQTLEPFYARVPAALKGLVELVYDYQNRPFLRVLEGLIYRSQYYKPQLQSLRLAVLDEDASRPFFLSTPRLPRAEELHWPVAFSDERVDQLFSLSTTPKSFSVVRDLLGPNLCNANLAAGLLTDQPPPPPPDRWEASAARVRYVGHASVLVEWNGISILTDPFVPVYPASGGPPRISFQELPEMIDYALITHAHADHFSLETLLRLRRRIRHLVLPRNYGLLIGDVSLKLMATALGFRGALDLDTYESIALPDGEITAVPFLGEHGDIAHGKTAYLVRLGREKMLFAADSMCLEEATYTNIRQSFGPVDSVFMNTEVDGSPLTFGTEALYKRRNRKLDQSRRCRGSNAQEGLRLLKSLGTRRFYNYAMGLEPWLSFVVGSVALDSPRIKESDLLLQEARALGLVAHRLHGPTTFVLGE